MEKSIEEIRVSIEILIEKMRQMIVGLNNLDQARFAAEIIMIQAINNDSIIIEPVSEDFVEMRCMAMEIEYGFNVFLEAYATDNSPVSLRGIVEEDNNIFGAIEVMFYMLRKKRYGVSMMTLEMLMKEMVIECGEYLLKIEEMPMLRNCTRTLRQQLCPNYEMAVYETCMKFSEEMTKLHEKIMHLEKIGVVKYDPANDDENEYERVLG